MLPTRRHAVRPAVAGHTVPPNDASHPVDPLVGPLKMGLTETPQEHWPRGGLVEHWTCVGIEECRHRGGSVKHQPGRGPMEYRTRRGCIEAKLRKIGLWPRQLDM